MSVSTGYPFTLPIPPSGYKEIGKIRWKCTVEGVYAHGFEVRGSTIQLQGDQTRTIRQDSTRSGKRVSEPVPGVVAIFAKQIVDGLEGHFAASFDTQKLDQLVHDLASPRLSDGFLAHFFEGFKVGLQHRCDLSKSQLTFSGSFILDPDFCFCEGEFLIEKAWFLHDRAWRYRIQPGLQIKVNVGLSSVGWIAFWRRVARRASRTTVISRLVQMLPPAKVQWLSRFLGFAVRTVDLPFWAIDLSLLTMNLTVQGLRHARSLGEQSGRDMTYAKSFVSVMFGFPKPEAPWEPRIQHDYDQAAAYVRGIAPHHVEAIRRWLIDVYWDKPLPPTTREDVKVLGERLGLELRRRGRSFLHQHVDRTIKLGVPYLVAPRSR
jgi:hypothetical protein